MWNPLPHNPPTPIGLPLFELPSYLRAPDCPPTPGGIHFPQQLHINPGAAPACSSPLYNWLPFRAEDLSEEELRAACRGLFHLDLKIQKSTDPFSATKKFTPSANCEVSVCSLDIFLNQPRMGRARVFLSVAIFGFAQLIFVASNECHVNEEVWNCSMKSLKQIPDLPENVTILDLSMNKINFLGTEEQNPLRHLQNLHLLNLSNNPIPHLQSRIFSRLRNLQLLDLSRCGLGDDSSTVKCLLQDKQKDWAIRHEEWRDERAFSLFLKKRDTVSLANNTKMAEQDDKTSRGYSWQYIVIVLGVAIGLSVFIAVAVKCKLFHRYLSSYRHSLLNEPDAYSNYEPENMAVRIPDQYRTGSQTHASTHSASELEDDDDGFIEDNYIQASERQRAEQEAELDEEDDLHFTIS
ncbi:type III endosome membrane protein TEMP [Erpetoichthys calabaricus]|uniref:type III endosome membrane protein TEMP n=1 Tax=Erpetoichthys calabaricus TaxID=27687 RepID=UPI0022346A4C|nr:type III endosome membrane protein TEMP [Erpetoichthys calabaricus]